MTLRLIREPSVDGATHGVLFVDGHYQCFTLEDEIREQPGRSVEDWKVPGQTAIPSGRYRVVVTPSQRFQRDLPLLLEVPGFSGIRVHPGNGTGDTSGCILVGQDRQPGRLRQSRVACEALCEQLHLVTAAIYVSVENPEA